MKTIFKFLGGLFFVGALAAVVLAAVNSGGAECARWLGWGMAAAICAAGCLWAGGRRLTDDG